MTRKRLRVDQGKSVVNKCPNPSLSKRFSVVFQGSSQGAQLEVYTLHSPLNAIQKR